MTLLPFFALTLKRLRHNPSLSVLLTLSVALMVGLMICVPLFTNAVCLRVIQEEFSKARGVEVRYTFPISLGARPSNERPMTLADALRYREMIGRALAGHIGLEPRLARVQVESPLYLMQPPQEDASYTGANLGTIRVVTLPGLEAHVKTVVGEPFGEGGRQDAGSPAVIPVWVERAFADRTGWQPGEIYDLDDAQSATLGLLRVKIVGIVEAEDPAEDYWGTDPARLLGDRLLTTAEEYEASIGPRVPQGAEQIGWWYVLDERRMNLSRVGRYLQALEKVRAQAAEALPGASFSAPFEALRRVGQLKFSLTLILFGFASPLLSILLYFNASLSALLARSQEREAAMLASRGMSRRQLLALAGLEAGLILLLALPLGILIGLGLARLLSTAYGFLEFDFQMRLPVRLGDMDLRLVAVALGVGALARLIPAWREMPHSLVLQERALARWRAALGPLARLLIVLLLATTYYAYRKLAQVGSLPLLSVRLKELAADPLPSLAPLLFLFAAPLVASVLFTHLVGTLALLGKLSPWPAVYLGLVNLGREGWRYRASVFMLALTLGAGVFYASLARSSDAWLVEQRRYEVGADLRFDFSERDSLRPGMTLDEYDQIPGVIRTMAVGEWSAVPRVGKELASPVRLLGIDRLRFPQVAYFRDDYAPQSLGALMNRLGAMPNGLLIPQELAERHHLTEGDHLILTLAGGEADYELDFVIVGLLYYFPTMYPKAPLVVANLEYIQAQVGGSPTIAYWMRLRPDADTPRILHDAGQPQWLAKQAHDLRFLINRDRNRLERVGIMGMLSLCFAVGAILAGLGFLLQSAASLVARAARLAVLQAMGLERKEMLLMVGIEHLLVLLYGVFAGTGLGLVASRLYVPFFRLAESREAAIPPFIPYVNGEMAMRLALMMALTLAMSLVLVLMERLRARPAGVLRSAGQE